MHLLLASVGIALDELAHLFTPHHDKTNEAQECQLTNALTLENNR